MMATSWKSQQGKGEYALQFETDDEGKYKLVEKAAQMAMDGKTVDDMAEVKHGEWIDKWDGKYANPTYVCSNCGEKALLECYINELHQWRYRQSLSIRCPHCGAKMDGGKTT